MSVSPFAVRTNTHLKQCLPIKMLHFNRLCTHIERNNWTLHNLSCPKSCLYYLVQLRIFSCMFTKSTRCLQFLVFIDYHYYHVRYVIKVFRHVLRTIYLVFLIKSAKNYEQNAGETCKGTIFVRENSPAQKSSVILHKLVLLLNLLSTRWFSFRLLFSRKSGNAIER